MTEDRPLPFVLEGPIETAIGTDPRWLNGMEFGEPRPAHPEGAVKFHVADVLRNVDQYFSDFPLRSELRLIALVHDSFKGEVDPARPRHRENHHGMIARRFAEAFVDDTDVLDVIELHDEAFNAWQCGFRDDRWQHAERRATALVKRLKTALGLYLAFYKCDNETSGKQRDCYRWFVAFSQD